MLEVCVENVRSAINACKGGAKRLELCSCLALGGLTPTFGLFKAVRRWIPSECKIFIMIRSKPGEDYMYDDLDLDVMVEDVAFFKQNGADGFVFGCLTENKDVDEKACRRLLEAAKGSPCTFHRAFDVVQNPEESLKTLIDLGMSRILTSGQEKTALLGKTLIRKLVKESGSRIVIMPGGGIDQHNLKEILETTGVQEFHGSARCKTEKEGTWITDETVVREMLLIAKNFIQPSS